MAESTVAIDDPPHIEFDSGLSIPPIDDTFFSQFMFNDSDSGDKQNDDVLMDDIDFDFSFDDLCPPSLELDDILLPDPRQNPNQFENSYSIDKGNDQFENSYLIDKGNEQLGPDFKSACPELVHISGDTGFPRDQSSNESGVVNLVSPELESNRVSGDVLSPESNGSNRGSSENCVGEVKGLGSRSPESQVSGNCSSDESRNSNNYAKSVSSLNLNNNFIRDGADDVKIKFEKSGNSNANSSVLKRKKESEELINNSMESRINKSRKSDYNLENKNNNFELSEEDEKHKARLMRNRESAQLSRQRKKHYVDELGDKVRAMHSTIQDLNSKISYFMAENVTLRQQMAGGNANGGAVPPPGAPPLPYPAVMYPWMPYPPPYMMKPQGSQVPLVPIPRLKPQQPAQAPKARKAETKKNDRSKTKKVAGISFLGVLFFIMLFGGLIPMVNMMYGGVREALSSGENDVEIGFYENHHERLLMANGTEYGVGRRDFSGNSSGKKGHGFGRDPDSDEFAHLRNGREPLVASLYVPRNDKLVKIDGNLIIHSILASEKTRTSKRGGENGLAVRGDLVPAIPIPGPRALGSGSVDKENLMSKGTDGSLQQWFREGLSGPMLSSGMCTEVFHFDISPASSSGAIVPSSRNVSQINNSSHVSKGRNRRILKGLPIPLPNNISKETNSTKENLNVNNSSVSSMVVSVLVDPREAGDADVDGVMGTKSLSRIFVVVLIDSVKYVTYSCMLPFKGASPHLVTT